MRGEEGIIWEVGEKENWGWREERNIMKEREGKGKENRKERDRERKCNEKGGWDR